MMNSRELDDLLSAEERFREYLRSCGLKYTAARRAILSGVMRNDQHFEADQLLFELRARGERVAKATIYRTLPLLVSCGIIRQLQFGDKGARYEHIVGHAPHDHMVCHECRRVIEFDDSEVTQLAARLAARHDFQLASHRFQMSGLCAECRAARDTQRPARQSEPEGGGGIRR